MIWLALTEYLCHTWPHICSVWYNHILVLSYFMTYHRICHKRITTGFTIGTETVYLPFRTTRVHPCALWGYCCLIVSFQCNVLFVLSPFLIAVFPVILQLRLIITPFGIIKHFLYRCVYERLEILEKYVCPWSVPQLTYTFCSEILNHTYFTYSFYWLN